MVKYAYVRLAFMVLFVFFCSSCGVIKDVENDSTITMQEPHGKLFSSEFYQRATPEEVKKEIGGKSLATSEYIQKYKTGMSAFNIDAYPFTPRTGVTSRTITPLSAAVENTPYPEVIRMLLEAGAVFPRGYDFRDRLLLFLHYHPTPEAFDLVSLYLPANRCEALTSVIRHSYEDVRSLELYLTKFPDTDMNCRQSSPLEMAIRGDQVKIVTWMAQKGTKLRVKFANGYSPAKSAVLQRYWWLAKTLIDLGADASTLTAEEMKNIQESVPRKPTS